MYKENIGGCDMARRLIAKAGRPKKLVTMGGLYEPELVAAANYLAAKYGQTLKEVVRRAVLYFVNRNEIPGIEEYVLKPQTGRSLPDSEEPSLEGNVLYEQDKE
jgi:hypothetical protein